MRFCLVLLFLVVSSLVSATTYYISSSGNDDNNGISESTPWKSIVKVNSSIASFQPGDRILFRRGDTFYGTLAISKSGLAGAAITFGAYGTGAKPVLTGFKTVTGWTSEGNNIYSASITSEGQTNMVIINGVQYGMARYPDAGTNLKYESHTTATKTITDTGIGDAINWKGAELVINKWDWLLDRCTILNHSGDVFTYEDLGSTGEPRDGRYYFIQNDLKCVTTLNEWYHNSPAGKFYLYGNPSVKTIKVATLENIIILNSCNYVVIDGLYLCGSIFEVIKSISGGNITIQNCDAEFGGSSGIAIQSANSNVIGNSIKNCNGDGIYAESSNITISDNNILNIGLLPGQVQYGMYTQGIRTSGPAGNVYNISYNSIQNISYNGIGCGSGQSQIMRYNFINYACKILDDGAGIYIPGASSFKRIIENNIILNCGAGNSLADIVRGIYLDEDASDCLIRYNTVAGCLESGIMLHRAHSNIVSNNTLFNNNQQMYLQAIAGTLYNNLFENNILISKGSSQLCMKCYSSGDDVHEFGDFNYNFYARPVKDDNVFYTYSPSTGSKYRVLSDWQLYTGQDLNSQKTPALLSEFTDTADIDFYYNTSKSNKVISLSQPMIDIAGNRYSTSITLLPYRSVILFVDPEFAPPKTPVYRSSVIESSAPNKLIITFNVNLANIVPASSVFKVMVNSVSRTVNSVTIDGIKVILTLSNPVIDGDIVTITYTEPGTNPLQSEEGLKVASISAQPVTTNLSPIVINAIVDNNAPGIVKMTFTSELAMVIPSTSAFTVMVNSVQRTVNVVSISGTYVMLTLASPVVSGDIITVSYKMPSSNALRSATNIFVVSYSAEPVTFKVEDSCPVLEGSIIESSTPGILKMTFSSELANVVPSGSAFTVMVNSVQRTVNSVSISGTDVMLTLASPVVSGDIITVSYRMPSSNALRSVSWCFVLGFSAQQVTNNVESTCPVLVSSIIENSTPGILEMTFNSGLANVIPSPSAFTVTVNSVQRTVNSVAISGTDVNLTLASPIVSGDLVTVAYRIPTSNALRSVSWCFVLGFSAQQVTNNVEGTCPVLVSSIIESSTPGILIMTFNSELANVIPSPSAFTVMVNSLQRTVSSVAISGTDVKLTMASPVVSDDLVTVAYRIPTSNALRSVSWCFVLGFSAQQVTNNVEGTCPVLVSSIIESSTPGILIMTFNSELANVIPSPSAFTVMVNSVQRTVSSVAISGTDVKLTMASPVVSDDLVTVAYRIPTSNALRSVSWCFVLGFSAKQVTNSVESTCPVLVNASVEFINPDILEMAFNSELANIIPSASAFTVMVNSVQRTVSKVTISSTKVSLTLVSQVVYGDIITVAYRIPTSYALRSTSWCFVLGFSASPVTNKCLPAAKSQMSSANNIFGKDQSTGGFNPSESDSSEENAGQNLLNSLSKSGNILIYPNPASEHVNIVIQEPSSENQIIRIFNFSGKLCLESVLFSGKSNIEIPINLKPGLYIVKIIRGKLTMYTQKLLVQ